MEASYVSGDPDVGGVSFGDAAVCADRRPGARARFWFGLPEATGPFLPSGAPKGAAVNLAAIASTNPFDPSVFADTGDLWAQSVNPSAGYSALTLALGSLLDAIHVAFVHSARHEGAVVRGFIAIDTFNLVSLPATR